MQLRSYSGLAFLVFCVAVFFLSKYWKATIRKVGVIDQIEEAIKRSIEMGRPVVYTEDRSADPRAGGEYGALCLAGLLIMRYVAQLSARHRTKLWVPVGSDALYSLAQETIREAYVAEGAGELFNPYITEYLTNTPAFTARVIEYTAREKPGAFMMIGTPGAETITMLEIANMVGAKTISAGGIDRVSDLLVASDYCMLGDEIFAAAAKVSGDPLVTSAIQGQDVFKIVVMALISVGAILYAVGSRIIYTLMGS